MAERRDFLVLASLVAASVTAGCGFRPRGSRVAAADVGLLLIDADPNLSIVRELSDALTRREVRLAANRDQAQVLLRVSDERIAERIVSVQSLGRVSEFELSHGVDLVVQRVVDGVVLEEDAQQQANRVRVTREYTYDETDVLGKDNEARTLREEMRAELVRQIVLRTLASLADASVA